MNYYAARQKKTDKKWDYTVMNDGKIWPVGYCADAGGSHHDDKSAAQECYTKYLLDNRLRLDGRLSETQLKCDVCKAFTDGLARVGDTSFTLCDKHRTVAVVRDLFGVVGEIASS